jgi:hypothetical protein
MENKKLKNALLAMGLGLGLSGNASALDDLCVYSTYKCGQGYNFACDLMRTYC